jgi:glucose-6-phosphate 1-epimerase
VVFFQLAAVLVLTNGFGRVEVDPRGAHLLSYRPHGEREVFFRSEKRFAPPKWYHGGMPVCWPWFGKNGDPGTPAHGLVWSREWRLIDHENGAQASRAHLVLEEPDAWRLDYTITLDERLEVKLDMKNLGKERFVVTTGLHPYFSVSDLENVHIVTPKGSIRCFPGMDGGRRLGEGTYDIVDAGWRRTIRLKTFGNTRLVIWNAGPDRDIVSGLAENEWRRYVCVEPAVIPRGDGFYLMSGESRSLGMSICVNDTDALAAEAADARDEFGTVVR